jgi:hypothetical protein
VFDFHQEEVVSLGLGLDEVLKLWSWPVVVRVALGDELYSLKEIPGKFLWEADLNFFQVNIGICWRNTKAPVAHTRKRRLPGSVALRSSRCVQPINPEDFGLHLLQTRKAVKLLKAIFSIVLAVIFVFVSVQGSFGTETLAAVRAGMFTGPWRLAAKIRSRSLPRGSCTGWGFDFWDGVYGSFIVIRGSGKRLLIFPGPGCFTSILLSGLRLHKLIKSRVVEHRVINGGAVRH